MCCVRSGTATFICLFKQYPIFPPYIATPTHPAERKPPLQRLPTNSNEARTCNANVPPRRPTYTASQSVAQSPTIANTALKQQRFTNMALPTTSSLVAADLVKRKVIARPARNELDLANVRRQAKMSAEVCGANVLERSHIRRQTDNVRRCHRRAIHNSLR